MLIVTDPLPVAAVLVAVTATALDPVTVGVPLMTRVLLFRLRPSGRPVAPKLVGEWVAVMV